MMKYRMRLAGNVARVGQKRNTYKILVSKLEGKRPLIRNRRTWEENIRMDLTEIGWKNCELDAYGSG
jgi:hypothetical protein